MKLIRFSTLFLVFQLTVGDDSKEDVLLERILRDITGRYHPELHGEHAHAHALAHVNDEHQSHSPESGVLQALRVTSGFSDFPGRFSQLPPVPGPATSPDHVPFTTPNGYANCGCTLKGRCAPEAIAVTAKLLQVLKNDVVCGAREYDLCCYDDPWAGPVDQFTDKAPCLPVEYCVKKYGDDPQDVQLYGTIGPCLGLGSVRCLDNKVPIPSGPTTIVVPIYNPPRPPTPTPPITVPPTPVYEPPTVPPTLPPTPPPPVYEPPTVPPTLPPTLPPSVYEPPTVPPPVYEPPAPIYEPPAPIYEPPAPPPTVYEPPEVYEPPSATYDPPVPSDTYDVPDADDIVAGIPHRYGYRRYHDYFGGRYHRFGSPYYGGYYGGYPGFGFRKRIHFSKGFFG